jgi:hypothetical protein
VESTLLTDLTELIGQEKTSTFLATYGGQVVYIGSQEKLTPESWLSKTLGFESALRLSSVYGRTTLTLPLAGSGLRSSVWAKVEQMVAEGKSVNQIVRATGLHHRTIRRHRAGLKRGNFFRSPGQPRTINLFNYADMADEEKQNERI